MKPEAQASQKIDQFLTKAGWIVQDYKQINLGASFPALRKFARLYPMLSC